jgi:predicted O-methyltransferase YrrM
MGESARVSTTNDRSPGCFSCWLWSGPLRAGPLAEKGETLRVRSEPRQLERVISLLFDSGSVIARRDGKLHNLFPVGIPLREGEALRAWVKREDAASTIEVGLGYGISALFICDGLLANGHANARHVALDPNQSSGFSDAGLQVIDDAGATGMLEFYAERSEIALPRFLSLGRSFDLAFIDGNHRFEGVFLDLIYLGRLVRRSGVVILDDYQLASAKKAVRFCVANLGWALQEEGIADERHHWAVLRTPAVPLERNFDHFVDF